jgi:UDP-GlcNAc:undecaprenyl-phosphate GlcNAc-1-phosphate transferase
MGAELGLYILAVLVVAGGAAAILAAVLCGFAIQLGVSDAPDGQRKLQKAPVPTAGGLGFGPAAIAAAALGLFGSGLNGALFESSQLNPVVYGAVAALALGFADDRFNIRARWKLVIMIAIAAGMAVSGVRAEMLLIWPETLLTLSVLGATIGSALWLVVLMNAVNFMDGANGLAMGMSCFAALGLGIAGAIAGEWDIAVLCIALAGALAGFLVWNIPGKLFAGDAGALFTGAMLGGASLLLVQARPDWVWLPPLLLLPILSDVLLTLAWRARHRKPLFSAHRDHAYQIALKAGLKHWQVSSVHAVASANSLGVAIIAAITGGYFPALGFLGLLGASIWVHLRVRRSGVRAGLVGANIP